MSGPEKSDVGGGSDLRMLSHELMFAKHKTAQKLDIIGDSSPQRAHTTITLYQSGPLAGLVLVETRVWTGIKGKGFTAGIEFDLKGKDGVVLFTSRKMQIGVDGTSTSKLFKAVGAAPSDRTVRWEETVPPEVAQATDEIVIRQWHDGKFRGLDIAIKVVEIAA